MHRASNWYFFSPFEMELGEVSEDPHVHRLTQHSTQSAFGAGPKEPLGDFSTEMPISLLLELSERSLLRQEQTGCQLAKLPVMFSTITRVIQFFHNGPPVKSTVKPFTEAHLALNSQVYRNIFNGNSLKQYCQGNNIIV